MRKEIADKWVAALRSGEYKQSRYSLTDGQGFCCLGVLCDLARKEGLGNFDNGEFISAINEDDYSSSHLPKVVSDWADIDTSGGYVPSLGNSLMHLNDNGQTFEYLADVIEQNYESI